MYFCHICTFRRCILVISIHSVNVFWSCVYILKMYEMHPCHIVTFQKCILVLSLHPKNVSCLHLVNVFLHTFTSRGISKMYFCHTFTFRKCILFCIHDAADPLNVNSSNTHLPQGEIHSLRSFIPPYTNFLIAPYTAVNGCPDGVSLRLPLDCS